MGESKASCFYGLCRPRVLCLVWVPLIMVFTLALYFNITISVNTPNALLPSRTMGLYRLLEPSQKRRLPQCIIIGVRKCGTRALLEYLDLHPHVETSGPEVHFFDNDSNYRRGIEWYLNKMPMTYVNQYTIEKSPKYFIDPRVPERIKSLNNSMKLLVILRDPTSRLVSDYVQTRYFDVSLDNSVGFETFVLDPLTGDINLGLKAVQISIYHQFFSRWFFAFPMNQIHVVDGDNLMIDPVAELSKIERFLGIEHRITYDSLYFNTSRGFYCLKLNETFNRCLSASKGRKHPKLKTSLRETLNDFFRPHNEKLFQMLNKRFNWS